VIVPLTRGIEAPHTRGLKQGFHAEIVYALGYQYPQYFTRAFKNLEGHTPNEYRKAVR